MPRLTGRLLLLLSLVLPGVLLLAPSIQLWAHRLRGDAYRPGPIPGVAFDLAPDYGTAAIHTENGSVAVALVEGTTEYKSFMRRQTRPGWIPEPVCDRLPQYLCSGYLAADMASTEALLSQLRASVEARLGTSICLADVGISDLWWRGSEYRTTVVQGAVERIGLRQVRTTVRQSAAAAVYAGVPRAEEDGGPLDTILAIDYSRYGISSMVYYFDKTGYLNWVTRERNGTLGADSAGQAWHADALREYLERFTRREWGGYWGADEVADGIGTLVLHGDSTRDATFRTVLEGVLGPELVERARDDDPLFASARGVAAASYVAVNSRNGRTRKPAPACCWGSRFHSCLGPRWEDRAEGSEYYSVTAFTKPGDSADGQWRCGTNFVGTV